MSEVHVVELLLRRISKLRYPAGVEPTHELVAGPEYFPEGCGIWTAKAGEPWPEPSLRGVIALGHYADSVEGYRRNLGTGGLMPGPTWRNLRLLLEKAGIGLEEVFLTNFFMGLASAQMGKFPGARDRVFRAECVEILRYTIRLLQPRALLVFGGHTRRYLADLAESLDPWRHVATFQDLDDRDLALVRAVTIPDAPAFNVANIIHPAGATMGNNVSSRRYRGRVGLDAEIALVTDAASFA